MRRPRLMRGKQRSCLFQPFIPAARRHSGQTTRKSVFAQIFVCPSPPPWAHLVEPRALTGSSSSTFVGNLFHRNIPKDVASLNIQFPVDIFDSRRSFFSGKRGTVCGSPPRPASPADGPTFSTTAPGRSISPVALFIHWKSPLNSWRGDSCISQGQAQINVNSDLHPS